MRSSRVGVVFAALVAMAGLIEAQVTASIGDTVTDQSGAVVPGAKVRILMELPNAFNMTSFLVGGAGGAVNSTAILGTTFGRTTNAYQDISTTNDPGGRIVQLVLRINF